jgi:hypothetical protein
MKTFWHDLRQDTPKTGQGRSWASKPFAGTLAATAGTTVAAAAVYLWSGREPNFEALRLAAFIVGYCLLLDIIKIFKQK